MLTLKVLSQFQDTKAKCKVQACHREGHRPNPFTKNGAAAAIDEDSFCATLGKVKCALALETRYTTFLKTSDIDLYASYGIKVLRIPVGYAAFMKAVNGDHYHTGSQLFHMSRIANYAVKKACILSSTSMACQEVKMVSTTKARQEI